MCFYFIFIRLKIVDFLFDFTFADERMDDFYRFLKSEGCFLGLGGLFSLEMSGK